MTVYTINEPYKSQPSVPSSVYLEGILEGCRENGISEKAVLEAAENGNAAYEERKSPPGRPGEVKAPAGGKSRHPGAASKSV